MEDSPFNIKNAFSLIILAFVILLIKLLFNYADQKTKIVFCDVGQGDAAYIRVKNQYDILIDSGPDKQVLDCLGRYMPFFDRKIELAIISHPDKDHVGGFLNLIGRYQFDRIYSVPIITKTKTYSRLKKMLSDRHISITEPETNTQIRILKDILIFYWPEKTAKIGFTEANDLSLVFLFQEKQFSVLFTGDISMNILERLLEKHKEKVTILKIPHHGSKYNLSKKILSLADPMVCVISCSINNSYGHPSKEVTEMIKAAKIIIRRTDKEGDIIFKLPN